MKSVKKRKNFRDVDYPGQDLGKMYADEVAEAIAKMQKEGKRPGCFIAESLQSCGGQVSFVNIHCNRQSNDHFCALLQILPPPNYLREVYKHVRAAGGLCIADEVQVGFGRVGTHMWAFQTQGDDVVPDIVTMGKPMGNGHPVAAVVTTEEVAASFKATGIAYFNTFGGNPVSCAIASAVMDVIEDEKLLDRAKETGDYFIDKLKSLMDKHPIIGDVRGRGMFIGIDLVKDRGTRQPHTKAAEHALSRFREEHILMQSDGPYENVLKIKPPLAFSKLNADHYVEVLDLILEEISAMPE